MRVMDFTTEKRHEFTVDVAYHSVVDLLLTMWVLAQRMCEDPIGDLDIDDTFFDDFLDNADPIVANGLHQLESGEPWVALLTLVPLDEERGTVDGFIEFLANHDPVDIRTRMLWLYQEFNRDETELAARAAGGDTASLDALLDSPAFSHTKKKSWRETLRYLIGMEPEATRDFLVDILSAAQATAFREHEEEFRPYLESDFAAKEAMSNRLSPTRLVEIASNGISIEDRQMDIPILLLPSMVARPWVVLAESPALYIMCYPVSDRTLASDPDAPPSWLVKLHKALGDERRLKILRRLASDDASLVELSNELDIPKSTLHHHMMLLRAAGLIRVHVGDDKRYELRDETLPEAATYLNHYIHRSNDAEEIT